MGSAAYNALRQIANTNTHTPPVYLQCKLEYVVCKWDDVFGHFMAMVEGGSKQSKQLFVTTGNVQTDRQCTACNLINLRINPLSHNTIRQESG